MSSAPLDFFLFTINGLLGGVLNVLISAESLSQLKRFRSWKLIVIGAIVGYFYCLLHSEYNFPNGVMSFVAGYFGQDFVARVLGIVRRGRR